jgi:hypothetical protein
MTTMTIAAAEELAVRWRSTTDLPEGMEHPAGPLFSGDMYTEAEISMTGNWTLDPETGTNCTGGLCVMCC